MNQYNIEQTPKKKGSICPNGMKFMIYKTYDTVRTKVFNES